MTDKLKVSLLSLLMIIISFTHSENIYAETVMVTRQDMLNVAKELHPPGCTDSMTADYCSLSTAFETRAEIYELLKQGKNKEEIISILVDKYGERILASPTREGFNLIAWITPGIAIIVGGLVIAILIRKWIHKRESSEEKIEYKEVSPEVEKMVENELKNWF